jgi:hypothetical protein
VVFVVWEISIIYLLYQTIKKQAPNERVQD